MRPKLAAYLLLALVLSGCAATKTYDPFKVAQSDIRGRVKVVALVPIELSTDAEDPAGVKAKFEWLIRSKLEEGGFKVIPSDEFASIWKKTVAQHGPIYDPASGKRDDKKFNAAFAAAARELWGKTGADALLQAVIAVVKAEFSSNLAEWHGAIDYVRPDGVWGVFSGRQYVGTVPALSLWVGLVDFQGTEMYVNAGGIQVMSKVGSGMKFYEVPLHDLFADQAKNLRSVAIALNPLIGQPAPPAN
ncbi:MAG TPA: hypothetical protein VKH64_03210 [Candidatus Binatia bacterium]|nr:hypothetical protein [Candidatus Binatia bacterium]